MIISQITINELREIDSIKLNINDSLVYYLSKEEGVSVKGTPSSFALRNVGDYAEWLFETTHNQSLEVNSNKGYDVIDKK